MKCAIWAMEAIFAFWCVCGPLSFATGSHYPGEELLRRGQRILTISKYPQQGNGFMVRAQAFREGEKGSFSFLNLELIRELENPQPVRRCDLLVDGQQEFALLRLADRLGVSVDDFQLHRDIISHLRPDGIIFVEHGRVVPQAHLNRLRIDEQIIHSLMTGYVERFSPGHLPVVTATMWSVAGHYYDVRSGVVYTRRLPWELNPKFRDLSSRLKRERRERILVWEWGRAAKSVVEDGSIIPPILAAANYQELRNLGVPLENAYVMFHTIDSRHTLAYDRLFPGHIYYSERSENSSTLENRSSEALFMIPLSKILEKFPLEGRLHLIQEMRDFSDGRLTAHQAMDLLLEVRNTWMFMLDPLLYNESGDLDRGPMVVRDFSPVGDFKRARLFQEFESEVISKPSDLQEILVKTLDLQPSLFHDGNMTDPIGYDLEQVDFLITNKALEISNLDASALGGRALNLKRLMLTLAIMGAIELSGGGDNEQNILGGLNHLEALGAHIAISTSKRSTQELLMSLSPVQSQVFAAAGSRLEIDRYTSYEQREARSRDLDLMPESYTALFSIAQVKSWIRFHPELMLAWGIGKWERARRLSMFPIF